MKKTLFMAILLSFLTSLSSRADVILQDTFNYPDTINNATMITNSSGGLWVLHSCTAPGQGGIVKNHRLEVDTSTAYLGVTVTRTDDIHRFLSVTNGSIYTNVQQVLYASFIVNFTNLPTGSAAYFAHFYVSSSTFPCRIWAQTNGTVLPNTFRLGLDPGATTPPNKIYPVDLALNTDYQVVIGYCPVTGDPGGLVDDSVTMWINPVSFSDAHVTTSDAFAPGANIANAFAFRQASSFGAFLTVSNLVISTTFTEAFTNGVPSTNAVAPKIVVQPVGATNFITSSVTLSAVADGQGLGSLTYQWQTNGVNISNPDGNTNVLRIDNGSATTNDSANYTVVVTTPYGLSTTSSVATVFISSQAVPPKFLTQPVSQKIFTGQNMILTTTVASPGNLTYTWYSNNVVVTAGQADSGESSSYEIDNVTSANSATYKVAVTNDYANAPTNGVVSTNAVVAVSNAPIVTIAFLRTLVDPNNNYLATNSTQPYQATGIITTYTNITSGNTASYYLQDATAGIDIFATFGSTFRPALGDVVTFIGVMSSFSSGLELDADTVDLPYTSYTDLSNNIAALPMPLNIPFTITNTGYANMNTNIAGRLVELTNVFFGTNAGNTIASGFMTVTNGLGQSFNLWFSAQDLDTVGQTVPVFASSVTGVMFGSMNPSAPVGGVANPNFAVAVTQFSGIVVPVSPIPLSLSVSGGTFTFNWTDSSFSLQSATNVVGPWTTIPGATDGFTTNAVPADPTLFFRLYHP